MSGIAGVSFFPCGLAGTTDNPYRARSWLEAADLERQLEWCAWQTWLWSEIARAMSVASHETLHEVIAAITSRGILP